MAKKYIYLKPDDLQRVVATLDKAFPTQPTRLRQFIARAIVGAESKWFDIARAVLSIIILGIAIWRAFT